MMKTIGTWVDFIMKKDGYVKNIVSKYTKDISPDMMLSSYIDFLPVETQMSIKDEIEDYIKNGKQEDNNLNLSISANNAEIDDVSKSEYSGDVSKNVFLSFIKTLQFLGFKDIKKRKEDTPKEYLLYYKTNAIMSRNIRDIFSRFKSLKKIIDDGIMTIDDSKVKLFFGITNGNIEYGFIQNNIPVRIGSFKLTDGNIRWLLNQTLKPLDDIKNNITKLGTKEITLYQKIKKDMFNFSLGVEPIKTSMDINDYEIVFGYYGIGKWINNNKMDDMEYSNIKMKFHDFVSSRSWSSKVMIKMTVGDYWTYFTILLKR